MPPEPSPPPPGDPPLERLLDEAGQAAQPQAPGWQALPQKLAARPQKRPRRWWLPVTGGAAVAAGVLIFLLGTDPTGILPPPPNLQAEELPIRVERQDVEVTVLSLAETDGETLYMPLLQNLAGQLAPAAPPFGRFAHDATREDLLRGRLRAEALAAREPGPVGGQQQTGQALVKDRRLILNLKKGDNVVRFADVAASIDPTSVRFVSTTDPDGTQVVEQNFEYDLATADKLLQRYLDKQIVCVGRDGSETAGFLASADAESIVLASAPTPPPDQPKVGRETQIVRRATLQAIRLAEVPRDLLVKPTLVWKLRVAKPGRHETTVSYLCGLVSWHADYVAMVTPGRGGEPDLLDLAGWVSIDNRSGSTYPQAGLKLIAGDVNRMRDPWAVPDRRQIYEEFTYERDKIVKETADLTKAVQRKEFVEKSFFEYHLYALTAPSTVRDRQIKQLSLLQKRGIKAERRYVFFPHTGTSRVGVELTVKNDKDNQLGLPLPKGRVTLQQRDADGERAVLGQVQIDHTAVKEELELRYGNAFDVTGEFRQVSFVRHNDRHFTHVFEARMRNHKTQPVRARVAASLGLNWKITQSSHKWTQHDFQTVYFDFPLAADKEEVVTYTVDYQN